MKWTLVTGGAKGLGREICLTLAGQGYHPIIHYQTSRREAEELVHLCRQKGVDSESLHGDFSSDESVKNFLKRYVSRFPDTANLINNVGNYLIKSASQTSSEEWNQLFQTNLHAPFALIQGLLPSLKEAEGSIINIGVAGMERRADIDAAAYKITKEGLLTLTRSLARELASSFVRVNMVSPGLLENTVASPIEENQLPMRRFGTLREVSDVVAFLLDKKNSYITGQNIEVAGGIGL